MVNTLCLILTVSTLLVGSNAHFNPRFQPAFGPPLLPFAQRNMNLYSDYNTLGLSQVSSFNSGVNFGPQLPYGSPLFNSNSFNDFPTLEQQQLYDLMSPYRPMMLPTSPMIYPQYNDLSPTFNSPYRQLSYTKDVIESKRRHSFN